MDVHLYGETYTVVVTVGVPQAIGSLRRAVVSFPLILDGTGDEALVGGVVDLAFRVETNLGLLAVAARSDQAAQLVAAPGSCHRTMSFIIDHQTLAALEASRRGEPLSLSVYVSGVVHLRDRQPLLLGPGSGTQHLSPHDVADLLDQAGYSETFSVIVPRGERAEALGHLQTARRALAEGRAEDAAHWCRKVVDALWTERQRDAAARLKPSERSLQERYVAAGSALYSLTSAALHNGPDDPPDRPSATWSHEDAEAAVVIAAALIRRVQRPA